MVHFNLQPNHFESLSNCAQPSSCLMYMISKLKLPWKKSAILKVLPAFLQSDVFLSLFSANLMRFIIAANLLGLPAISVPVSTFPFKTPIDCICSNKLLTDSQWILWFFQLLLFWKSSQFFAVCCKAWFSILIKDARVYIISGWLW